MPDLNTEIHVRLVKQKDASALLELEKRNRSFFSSYAAERQATFYTLKQQKKRVKNFCKQAKKDEGYFFVVTKSETKQIIGLLMITEVLRGNLQSAWLGYFLDEAQNGRGYMREAVKQVLAYCFERLRLHRIEAGVMPANHRSMRVLENSGFQKEGLARQNVKIEGVWQDHYTFAILDADFN